jgi:hypothetical protein
MIVGNVLTLQAHASKAPMEFKEIRIGVLDSTVRTARVRGIALARIPAKDEK